jgi:excisionase family DNA binding protein
MRWYDSSMPDDLEQLLTVADVLNRLRISRPTLYRMLKSGQLPTVKIGKRTLFDPADVRSLIARSKEGPSVQAPLTKKEKRVEKRVKPPKKPPRTTADESIVAAAEGETEENPPDKGSEKPKRPSAKKPDDSDKQGRLL